MLEHLPGWLGGMLRNFRAGHSKLVIVQPELDIGDTVIDPRRIVCPTLVLIPTQDRIVPPASARRLAELIPRADARTIDLGHIGMVSGGSAPRRVYAPLLAWLANPPKP